MLKFHNIIIQYSMQCTEHSALRHGTHTNCTTQGYALGVKTAESDTAVCRQWTMFRIEKLNLLIDLIL